MVMVVSVRLDVMGWGFSLVPCCVLCCVVLCCVVRGLDKRKQSANRPILNSGGEEVLLDVGGQDATEPFEDVGHSDEAREILDGLLVGNLKRMVRFPSPSPVRSWDLPLHCPSFFSLVWDLGPDTPKISFFRARVALGYRPRHRANGSAPFAARRPIPLHARPHGVDEHGG